MLTQIERMNGNWKYVLPKEYYSMLSKKYVFDDNI